MSSEIFNSELEEIKSRLVSLLKRLHFKEISVLNLPGFKPPPHIPRSDDNPQFPTAYAVKNGSNYFFKVLTSDFCSKGPPDYLHLLYQPIKNLENSNLILVVPYGQKKIVSNWGHKIGVSPESIWEINTQ